MAYREQPTDTAAWYEFKVLLFGPGMHSSGTRARICFKDQVMEVHGPGVWLTVMQDRVTLKPGGFDGKQWLLSWETDQGALSAVLKGHSDMRLMQQIAPPAIAAQLAQGLKATRWRGRRLLWMLLAVALLPLLLLALFWANAAAISGWAASHVSLEDERRLGDLAFAQARPSLKLLETGPAVAMIQEVGGRLTMGSPYDYQWHVADNPQVNAFAMPGGHVVVYTGLLLAAHSAEEVAGVLAHEVQHVELRHTLENLIHALGWRAALAVALGDVSGGMWGDMAHRLVTLKYSRDLERHADLGGLKALRRAAISPDGMACFFQRLADREDLSLALLSTHPASAERMAALRAAIAAQGAHDHKPLSYDWKAIQRSIAGVGR